MDPVPISSSMDVANLGKRKRITEDLDPLIHEPPQEEDITPGNDGLVAKRVRRMYLDEISPSGPPLCVVDLPPQVLQHIFSFVHPVALGKVLSVCRKFNILLDSSSEPQNLVAAEGRLLTLKPNEIWARSRRLHLPGYPKPLGSLSELCMWRLVRVRKCQYCKKRARSTPSFLNSIPWTGGPGRDHVRTIWPFGVQSCGPCLESKLRKETELMLSGSSVLRPGLPFALFTPSFNYVTSAALRQQDPPAALALTKYFLIADIEEQENQLLEVQALGTAAVQEWFKGLQQAGKQRQEDAERVEQWEFNFAARMQFGPATSGSALRPKSPTPSLPSIVSANSQSWTIAHSFDAGLASPSRPLSVRDLQYSGRTPNALHAVPNMPLPSWMPAPGQEPLHLNTHPSSSGNKARFVRSQGKSSLSASQVALLKAEKRAEIEKRCQEIDPPIRASVLPFMEAFRAALLIPRPLNEPSWNHLKGRLLDQRTEAEQKERENLITVDMANAVNPGQYFVDEGRNARAWAELGTPPRHKLRTYADEYIASRWQGGIAVTPDTASTFAVDVISQVKKRYDASIIQEDQELSSRGMVLPRDSDIHNIRHLRLEDMKWLYDESIRPHTERFGKEIFLCRVCGSDVKRLAFEGLIQHYAAKHTSELSRGTVIVHWKAWWPEPLPFRVPSYFAFEDRRPEVGNDAEEVLKHPDLGYTHPGIVASVLLSSEASSYGHGRPPRHRTLYEEHRDHMTGSVLQALRDTDGVRAMPASIRIYVVIHQSVKSFQDAFRQTPSLSLFADCVNTQGCLGELQDLHGLHCHSCKFEHEPSGYPSHGYWLPQLLDHFHKLHVQLGFRADEVQREVIEARSAEERHMVDWRYDMVELPHPQIVRNIALSRDLSDHQFRILADVFPGLVGEVPMRRDLPVWEDSVRPDYHDQVGRPARESVLRYRKSSDDVTEKTRRHLHPGERTVTFVPLYEDRSHSQQPHLPDDSMPDTRTQNFEQAGFGHNRVATFHASGVAFGARGLPFRLHPPDDGSPIVDDEHKYHNEELARQSVAPSIVTRQKREPERTMTDAEHFLSSFDPLDAYDRAAEPMVRKSSVREDDIISRLSSGRATQNATPSRSQTRRQSTCSPISIERSSPRSAWPPSVVQRDNDARFRSYQAMPNTVRLSTPSRSPQIYGRPSEIPHQVAEMQPPAERYPYSNSDYERSFSRPFERTKPHRTSLDETRTLGARELDPAPITSDTQRYFQNDSRPYRYVQIYSPPMHHSQLRDMDHAMTEREEYRDHYIRAEPQEPYMQGHNENEPQTRRRAEDQRQVYGQKWPT